MTSPMVTIAWGRGEVLASLVASLVEAEVEVLEIWHQDRIESIPKEALDTLAQVARHVPLIGEINSTEDVQKRLRDLRQVTTIVEAFYTNIIGAKVLDLVKVINIHPSPLPHYRGAHPIPWQIIRGETESAVTFHLVDTGIDSGPIVGQFPFQIDSMDGYTEVLATVFRTIREQAGQVVRRVLSGNETGREQEHGNATYVVRRSPEDGLINWSSSSSEIRNLVRALTSPLPGAWTFWNGRKVIIDWVEIDDDYAAFVGRTCGQVAALSGTIAILTGDSGVTPHRVLDPETGHDVTREIRVNDRFTN